MNDRNGAKVLTVRQPHAYLLIHGSPNAGIKDVENRNKLTRYRGTLLIQASAKVDQAAYASYIADGVKLPPAEKLVTGAIIGSVEVTGCVNDSRSRWAIPGYQHWLTAAPRTADPVIPSKGRLSMYPAPDGWQASFRPTKALTNLSSFCIYTMRHSAKLDARAGANDADVLTERNVWRAGQLLWTNARRSGELMPVIFSAADQDARLMYWATIDHIAIDEDDRTTTCVYSNLTPITPARPLSSLRLRSTGQPLSEDFIRPYALCYTPGFLA